jgi:uncharacterized protein DUF885
VTRQLIRLCCPLAVLIVSACAAEKDWVAKSNEHAKVLLEAMARTSPESAAQYGVEGIDEEISDLTPGYRERNREITLEAQAELKKRLAAETDPRVKQDLEIMLDAVDLDLETTAVSEKLNVPYRDISRLVFFSLRSLLDDRVAESRRPAALVRLRRYAGMEEGYEPIAKLAAADVRAALAKGLNPPFRGQVEKNLTDSEHLLKGLEPLFEKYEFTGYDDALATIKRQVDDYQQFVRDEVLPKAREDYKLPPELYALSLRNFGIDIPPEELSNQAHGAFREIQLQMQEIGAGIARERGWESGDYRDVIRKLKEKQLVGEQILPHYLARLAEMEEIVRREDLVTIPDRKATIRLASEAESAASPAPHMSPPRLVGNTGEQGEFVLPLRVPDAEGNLQGFDDFTFDAASWTLTAHEARPGHEMQFASMVETGVSVARAVFAFNSTNVEGWALYTESFMKPYMPAEGQLISLQHRLLRAARAHLDPELQSGQVTPEEAMRVLTEEVVLSEPMARQEVERYTFRAPGQACSYFYGYSRMIVLRGEIQKALGAGFDMKRFHDFVLAQGLLPPSLLRNAVFEEFVQ